MDGVVVRLLERVDPRWIALLVVPALVSAAAAQDHDLAPSGDRAAALREPVRVLLAPDLPTAVERAEPVHVVVGVRSAVVHAAPRLRASRDGRAWTIEERGRAALAALDYDWRGLGYRVQFRPYTGRSLGTTNRITRTITVYVAPRQSELSLRTTLAHELGHALDFEHGTHERRSAYRRIRGLPSSSAWFPCNRCDDYSSPAGDFAEVFATWLVGPGDFRSRVKGPPTARELQELTPLLRLPEPTAASPAPTSSPQPRPQAEEHEPESLLPTVPDPPSLRGVVA